MVPGSTLMYGSSFRKVTFRPRDSRSAPIDAAARPFPSDETTPPVTKMYFVVFFFISMAALTVLQDVSVFYPNHRGCQPQRTRRVSPQLLFCVHDQAHEAALVFPTLREKFEARQYRSAEIRGDRRKALYACTSCLSRPSWKVVL